MEAGGAREGRLPGGGSGGGAVRPRVARGRANGPVPGLAASRRAGRSRTLPPCYLGGRGRGDLNASGGKGISAGHPRRHRPPLVAAGGAVVPSGEGGRQGRGSPHQRHHSEHEVPRLVPQGQPSRWFGPKAIGVPPRVQRSGWRRGGHEFAVRGREGGGVPGEPGHRGRRVHRELCDLRFASFGGRTADIAIAGPRRPEVEVAGRGGHVPRDRVRGPAAPVAVARAQGGPKCPVRTVSDSL